MPSTEFVNNVLVRNSISAVSGMYADTLNAKTGISSPDFNAVKTVSGKWNSVYSTVSSNSASWQNTYTAFRDTSATFLTQDLDQQELIFNDVNKSLTITNGNTVSLDSLTNELRLLSSVWQETYTTFKDSSGSFLTAETDSQTLSFDLSTNELSISNGNSVLIPITNIASLSTDAWNKTYTTVKDNSSSWSNTGSDVSLLSANWQNTYTTFRDNSSTFLTSETDSQTLSFNATNNELSISNGNSVILSLTSSGSDVSLLSSNWESTYTTFRDNSGSFLTSETDSQTLTFNISTNELSISNGNSVILPLTSSGSDVSLLSANWQNTYTTFRDNSSTFLTSETDSQTLTFNISTNELSISNGNSVVLPFVSSVNTGSDVSSLSANWENTYTTVKDNSSTWSNVGSDVSTISSNWEDAYTIVKNNSAAWSLSGSDSQTLSFDLSTNELSISNGNSVLIPITNIPTLSTNTWNETYTTVKDNSSNWSNTGSDVSLLSSNWESTYTTFRDNSSTFLTTETDSQVLSFNPLNNELSISNGNSVILPLTSNVYALTSNWQNTYNTVSANSAAWSNTYSILTSNSAAWSLSGNADTLIARVFNADTVTMNRGDVVYTFGANGDVMSVKLASNSGEATSSKTLGLINETILPGGIGYVTLAGSMDKLNLGTYAEGSALWLGLTPGTLTTTKPSAPNHGVYLGVIERANNGNGIAYVKVQNGYELNEIHDVLITSPLSGHILRRNSSNTLWVNTNDALLWDSSVSTVTANSASWSLAYTTLTAKSAAWDAGGSGGADIVVRSLTANWESTYNTVSANSASWSSVNTKLSLSGGVLTGDLSGTNIYGNSLAKINDVGGNYTIQLSDAGSILKIDSNVSSSVNLLADPAWIVGTQIICVQWGVGPITINASGVTILSYGNKITTNGTFSMCTLIYLGNDAWLLGGNLA
jgi:hypothetical protein